MSKYQNIWGKQINVLSKPVQPDEVITADEKDKEIQKLVKHGYLKEVEIDGNKTN